MDAGRTILPATSADECGVPAAGGVGVGEVMPGKLAPFSPAPTPTIPPAMFSPSGKTAAAHGRPRTDPTTLTTDYVMSSIIHAPALAAEDRDRVMREVLDCWTDHVNPGFLKYRKSVAEGGDFAALEWRDGEPGGATVISSEGREYIDLLGGFGIYVAGHSHPVIVAAVKAQLEKQALHSQELLDPLRAYCAALLAKTLPGELQYSFFVNSGAEAVEACLKFAMAATGRRHFIGVLGAFHGKTIGALSATSKAVFRAPFGGALLPFTHVPVNDVEALTRAFEASRFTGNEIAGCIIEPVLGEGGIWVCDDAFLAAARRLCDKYGAALIFDEVQSGMGRTGRMWACEHSGVAPDLMAIGKAFGGGVMPAAAAVGTAKMWAKYLDNPFLFTTTFGGCPVAMAAAIAALHVVDSEGLVAAAAEKGDWLLTRLRALVARYPTIMKAVRGRGLMIGLEFHDDAIGYAFARGAFSRGLLMSGTLVNSRVLRVEPPLTITHAQLETVMARFEETLAAMVAGGLGVVAPGAPAAGGAGVAAATAADAAAPAPAPVAGAAASGPGSGGSSSGSSSSSRPSRSWSVASHDVPTSVVAGTRAGGSGGGGGGGSKPRPTAAPFAAATSPCALGAGLAMGGGCGTSQASPSAGSTDSASAATEAADDGDDDTEVSSVSESSVEEDADDEEVAAAASAGESAVAGGAPAATAAAASKPEHA